MPLPTLALVLLLAAEPPARELFNGKDLAGWVVEGPREFKDGDKVAPVWVAKDGVLSCMVPRSSFGFLRYTGQEFADFHLSLEYRFAAPGTAGRRGNSGVGIRTVPFDPMESRKTRPSFACYEVQLQDDADRKPSKHTTGSLYRYVAPKEQAARPAPEWNAIEIKCVGPRIEVTLNGKKILDVDQTSVDPIKDKPLKGFICLQNHGSRVDFRNIKVREINAPTNPKR
ncbi:MAG: DUF1080 domain-containing protein [Gemmataceae bacterium]